MHLYGSGSGTCGNAKTTRKEWTSNIRKATCTDCLESMLNKEILYQEMTKVRIKILAAHLLDVREQGIAT